MKNALQLVPQYEPLPATFAEAQAVEAGRLSDFTTLSAVSHDQLLQEQIDELQGLVADLREKLALTQWDLSQKETLLHSQLHGEMELRIALKGAWRY